VIARQEEATKSFTREDLKKAIEEKAEYFAALRRQQKPRITAEEVMKKIEADNLARREVKPTITAGEVSPKAPAEWTAPDVPLSKMTEQEAADYIAMNRDLLRTKAMDYRLRISDIVEESRTSARKATKAGNAVNMVPYNHSGGSNVTETAFEKIKKITNSQNAARMLKTPIKAGVGASSEVIERVAARKQDLAENLGAYASSPEAAEALKKSGVFDIGSVEVRDSLKARNVGGDSNLRAAGASYSPGTETMRLTKNRVNSEALDASIDHELGHSMQKKTIGGLSSADGKAGPLVYEEKLRASLGPDIDKFLSSPEGYQALRKAASKEANVGSLYTADRIQAEPVELFTSLIQASHSSSFAQNTEAVEMLKKLMKFHGYAKGGIVYASNGALIGAQQGTDTIPAMLTPGEFVINRQSAQRHMPVLNAINSGHYAHGGVVQYLSGGGAVQPAYLANAGMVNNIANSSSQSGVLNSASAAKPVVMEKPAWVDEFISKFNQGASTLIQSATEISSGANNIVSGAQKLSEVSLPDSIALNGNFGFTQEAISNIIGRSVGQSVSVSNTNSAQQVAASESSTSKRLARGTDYAIS
jgi:predicted CopG family antitoxin